LMTNIEFTSEAVRAAKFREKIKGYSPEDVDAFLERAATAIDQLTTRLGEATTRAIKAETALDNNTEADEAVKRTLVLAQRTAEMAVREANEEAQRIRFEAHSEADRLLDDATGDSVRLRAEAQDEASRLREEAEALQATAMAQAASTMDEADVSARAMVDDATERVARLERESTERVAAERDAALAEFEQRRTEALEETRLAVEVLGEEHRRLRHDVEALTGYLAEERGRVLAVLTGAVTHLDTSLTPKPMTVPQQEAFEREVAPESIAADPAAGAPTTTEEPSGLAAGVDDQPAQDQPADAGPGPADDQPAEDQPAEDQPADTRAADDQPAELVGIEPGSTDADSGGSPPAASSGGLFGRPAPGEGPVLDLVHEVPADVDVPAPAPISAAFPAWSEPTMDPELAGTIGGGLDGAGTGDVTAAFPSWARTASPVADAGPVETWFTASPPAAGSEPSSDGSVWGGEATTVWGLTSAEHADQPKADTWGSWGTTAPADSPAESPAESRAESVAESPAAAQDPEPATDGGPASLLFTVGEESRVPEDGPSPAASTRPRKTLLGRRRG